MSDLVENFKKMLFNYLRSVEWLCLCDKSINSGRTLTLVPGHVHGQADLLMDLDIVPQGLHYYFRTTALLFASLEIHEPIHEKTNNLGF